MRRLILLLTLCALAAPFGDVGALSLAPVAIRSDEGTTVLDPHPAREGSELADAGAFLPAGAPAEAVPEHGGGGHGPSGGGRAGMARWDLGRGDGLASPTTAAVPSAEPAALRGLISNPSTAPPSDA